ncbi:S-adenosyl-L-methionine-dependent methyltransferases superfamily protein [Prunus dulcis]|uniref:S-adenosyl-L-methionine-dependent methyltransferases superfamily protein n=1 Tax=Prunus dulcis TaxID=3755 RepID=A0A4Y1RJE7_PRUDU|nr:S-adenosyl-L-methionine-dependent methyltransferases superfamily protein [Prunus dulcis]
MLKEQIHLYVDTLLEWNQRMNLTAVKEVNEVMERHIEDSLAIIPPIRNSYFSHCSPSSSNNLSLVDVGSGAGLPGLVLAIACPGWEVTLMESMNKRCLFLEHVVSHIGLSNVQVVRGRAENLGQVLCFREKFDVAVARAVAEMRVLVESHSPYGQRTAIVCLKTSPTPRKYPRDPELTLKTEAWKSITARLTGACLKNEISKIESAASLQIQEENKYI